MAPRQGGSSWRTIRARWALAENYGQGNEAEKLRTLDVLSNIPASEVAQFVISAYRTAKNDKERSASADAILKLAPRLTIDKSLVEAAQNAHSQAEKTVLDLE